MRRLRLVISSVDRVGSSEDGGACIEGSGDASLGDGDRLLLHDLVDRSAVLFLHLVKLVDAADAHVSQHQGTPFQDYLSRVLVSHNCRGQTRP